MEQELIKLIEELDIKIKNLTKLYNKLELDEYSFHGEVASSLTPEEVKIELKSLVEFQSRLVQIMEANTDWRYSPN